MSATTWNGGGMGGGIALPALTPMVKRLMIGLGAVWVVQMLLPSGLSQGLLSLFGLDPTDWFAFPLFLPVWQLVTYGALHASAFGHILWNVLYLYFFGTMLEGLIGSRRFLSVFLGGVLVGGLGSLIWKLFAGSAAITMGASGGCLCVMCVMAVLQPRTPVILLFIPVPLAWLAGGLVAIDALAALRQIAGEAGSGTDHFAHLAGAGFGFFAARLGWIWVDPKAKLDAALEARRADSEQADQQRLDDLLRRIHEQGIGSLTDREREFLKKVSKR